MEIEASDQGIVLNLGAGVTFDSVAKDMKNLQRVLKLNHDIIFQAEKLVQIDSAGLQLLLAFINTLNTMKIKYRWNKVPAILIQTAELLGMKNLLGL